MTEEAGGFIVGSCKDVVRLTPRPHQRSHEAVTTQAHNFDLMMMRLGSVFVCQELYNSRQFR